MKAGVRFVSYDHFKHMLADAEVSHHVSAVYLDTSPTIGIIGKSNPCPQSSWYVDCPIRWGLLLIHWLAGLGAGIMEAIFAVTPSETIK